MFSIIPSHCSSSSKMKSWLKSDQSTSSRFYSIHFNSSSHWSTFSLYHKHFILDLEKINIDQLSKNLKMHLNQVSARCSIMSLGIVLEFKRETGKNPRSEDHFVCTLRSVIQHRRCSTFGQLLSSTKWDYFLVREMIAFERTNSQEVWSPSITPPTLTARSAD